jgi:hypothetical protein
MIKNKRDTIKTLNVLTAWLLTLTVILRANGMIVFPLRAIRTFARHAMVAARLGIMARKIVTIVVGRDLQTVKMILCSG